MMDDRDPLRESRNTCGDEPEDRHRLTRKSNEYFER
jgi:hypothetical protein